MIFWIPQKKIDLDLCKVENQNLCSISVIQRCLAKNMEAKSRYNIYQGFWIQYVAACGSHRGLSN
jgi:hypothetical protein